jgi:hypothetical protein
MFQAVVQETPNTNSRVLDELVEGCQTENRCFASNAFHSSSLVASYAIHKCGYGCEHNTEADSDANMEEKDDAFHDNWIWLDTEKDVNFNVYASLDNGACHMWGFQH